MGRTLTPSDEASSPESTKDGDAPKPKGRPPSMPRLARVDESPCRKPCLDAMAAKSDERSLRATAKLVVDSAKTLKGIVAVVIYDTTWNRVVAKDGPEVEGAMTDLLFLHRANEAVRRRLGGKQTDPGELLSTFDAKVIVLQQMRLPPPCVVAIVADGISQGLALRHYRGLRLGFSWDCESCHHRGGPPPHRPI